MAGRVKATSKAGSLLLPALSLMMCLFVLAEVNYPVLRPQSRLALFGLLGLVLVFLHFPLRKGLAAAHWTRPIDVGCGVLVALCFAYVITQTEPLFRNIWLGGQPLGDRAGQEALLDYVIGTIGLLLVLEAARRAVGLALPVLSLVFLAYARFGYLLPDALFPHRGYDVPRIVSQTFLHSQGVFGIALKVMFSYVFPFILFGALLEATGATGFILGFARRVFRDSIGGPAKVAVLSSGMMGSLSGSAVANTATTGTFTIPMMRSAGFSPTLAAGVEAAASTGGALVPPIMGAGAYMMLEIIDPPVTYLAIIRAAIVPAVLYYVALLLAVHFHARRLGAHPAAGGHDAPQRLSPAQGAVFVAAFLSLIALLLCGFSPFRSVSLSLVVILVVSACHRDTRLSWRRAREAIVGAARSGTALVAAAACVGVILGVVTLTGVGGQLPAAILPLAENNLLGALALLMVSTIVLGMGLPSAVCYLLMATLVGPVLGKLGIVPLAAHLFIFYFGMMSMVTPPVALAAYTAAAIAKADIMKAGVAACRLSLIGFALPYAFVINPSLLLLAPDGGSVLPAALASIASAVAGILFFAVAQAGFFRGRLGVPLRLILVPAAGALLLSRTSPDHVWIRLLALAAGGAILLWDARAAGVKQNKETA